MRFVIIVFGILIISCTGTVVTNTTINRDDKNSQKDTRQIKKTNKISENEDEKCDQKIENFRNKLDWKTPYKDNIKQISSSPRDTKSEAEKEVRNAFASHFMVEHLPDSSVNLYLEEKNEKGKTSLISTTHQTFKFDEILPFIKQSRKVVCYYKNNKKIATILYSYNPIKIASYISNKELSTKKEIMKNLMFAILIDKGTNTFDISEDKLVKYLKKIKKYLLIDNKKSKENLNSFMNSDKLSCKKNKIERKLAKLNSRITESLIIQYQIKCHENKLDALYSVKNKLKKTKNIDIKKKNSINALFDDRIKLEQDKVNAFKRLNKKTDEID